MVNCLPSTARPWLIHSPLKASLPLWGVWGAGPRRAGGMYLGWEHGHLTRTLAGPGEASVCSRSRAGDGKVSSLPSECVSPTPANTGISSRPAGCQLMCEMWIVLKGGPRPGPRLAPISSPSTEFVDGAVRWLGDTGPRWGTSAAWGASPKRQPGRPWNPGLCCLPEPFQPFRESRRGQSPSLPALALSRHRVSLGVP